MNKAANPTFLRKQPKRVLIDLVLELGQKLEVITNTLKIKNLSLATLRVLHNDLKKKFDACEKESKQKVRSLKNTVKRRRKVVNHG